MISDEPVSTEVLTLEEVQGPGVPVCHDLSTDQHVTLSHVGFCLKMSGLCITDLVGSSL